MLYQIGLILILIAAALIVSQRFKKNDNENESLVYEDEMSKDELDDIDENLN